MYNTVLWPISMRFSTACRRVCPVIARTLGWLWVDRPCNHRLLVAREATNLGSRHFPSLRVKYSSALQTLALISASLLTLWLLIMKYPLMPSRYLNCLVWAKLRFKIWGLPHTPDSQKHSDECYWFLPSFLLLTH